MTNKLNYDLQLCHACTSKHPKHFTPYPLPALHPRLKQSPLWYTPLQSKQVCDGIDNRSTEHAIVAICY